MLSSGIAARTSTRIPTEVPGLHFKEHFDHGLTVGRNKWNTFVNVFVRQKRSRICFTCFGRQRDPYRSALSMQTGHLRLMHVVVFATIPDDNFPRVCGRTCCPLFPPTASLDPAGLSAPSQSAKRVSAETRLSSGAHPALLYFNSHLHTCPSTVLWLPCA